MSLIRRSTSHQLNALDNSLQSYLGSQEFKEDMREQAGFGRWKGVKASAGEKPIVLVPDNSYSALKALMKSEYEKGLIPSKGYMHLKWCLIFIVAHVPKETMGEVCVELRDPGISTADPLPGCQVVCALSDLPRAVMLVPDYDMPLGKSKLRLGNQEMRRMFFLHTKVSGFTGQGVAISLFPVWDCDFRGTCNNYVKVPAVSVGIDRTERTSLLNCVKQLKQYAENALLTMPQSISGGTSFARPSHLSFNESKTLPSTSTTEAEGSERRIHIGAPSNEDLYEVKLAGTTGGPVSLVNGVSVGASTQSAFF
uniref:Movement protein n=1 Tax=Pelargonium zonate spot virus TaxID=116056 RepID=M9NYP3_PZSV|nr:putative movement protein [Pelargonium zonate spot virus]